MLPSDLIKQTSEELLILTNETTLSLCPCGPKPVRGLHNLEPHSQWRTPFHKTLVIFETTGQVLFQRVRILKTPALSWENWVPRRWAGGVTGAKAEGLCLHMLPVLLSGVGMSLLVHSYAYMLKQTLSQRQTWVFNRKRQRKPTQHPRGCLTILI